MLAITKIKALFGDVTAQDRELGRKIQEAQEKLNQLNSLPVTKTDYIEYVNSCIDKTAEEYIDRLGVQAKMDSERSHNFFKTSRAFHPVLGPNNMTGTKTPTMEALCWMFGDLIKKRHIDALDRLDWPTDTGPAMADRIREIASLEKSILSLENERAELRSVLAESGIRLD